MDKNELPQDPQVTPTLTWEAPIVCVLTTQTTASGVAPAPEGSSGVFS